MFATIGASAHWLLEVLEVQYGHEPFFLHHVLDETCIRYGTVVAGVACEMDSFPSNGLRLDRGIDVVFLSGLIGGELFNAPDDGPGCLVVDDGTLYAAVIAAALCDVFVN